MRSRAHTSISLTGKNPVVIDPNCDLKLAAKRILWGRFTNAGQVCLCPEYVLVPQDLQDALIAHMKDMYVFPFLLSRSLRLHTPD